MCVVSSLSFLQQLKYFTLHSERHRGKGTEYLETHCNRRTNQLPNGLSKTSANEDICEEIQKDDFLLPPKITLPSLLKVISRFIQENIKGTFQEIKTYDNGGYTEEAPGTFLNLKKM